MKLLQTGDRFKFRWKNGIVSNAVVIRPNVQYQVEDPRYDRIEFMYQHNSGGSIVTSIRLADLLSNQITGPFGNVFNSNIWEENAGTPWV